MAHNSRFRKVPYQSSTDIKRLKGAHLKGFHSASFVNDLLWICGWNRNIIGQKNIVFFKVIGYNYDVYSKKELKYPGADKPMTMFVSRDKIYVAQRNSNEIHRFNTKTHEFRSVLHTSDVKISAMCGYQDLVYILSKDQPSHIQVLDYSFQAVWRIATGLGNIHDCNIYMCAMGYEIIISTSFPSGSVRLIKPTGGVAWQVDIRNTPELLVGFNPCSVAASSTGSIVFADRCSDKVSKTLYDQRDATQI